MAPLRARGAAAGVLLLAAALPRAAAAAAQVEEAPLRADDECLDAGADGACSLSAVQVRALGSARRAADTGHAAAALGCEGPWCETLTRFNMLFDSMDPQTMQQAFDEFSEWQSNWEGIKIAVTKQDFYEMYHTNVQSKLSQYLPQGYFGWDFKRLGTQLNTLNTTESKAVVTRNGTITFNLGWMYRGMFWRSCVKSLPPGQKFDFSEVEQFDDCHECPAVLEYTLTKGGLSGASPEWKITDLVLVKMK